MREITPGGSVSTRRLKNNRTERQKRSSENPRGALLTRRSTAFVLERLGYKEAVEAITK